MKNTVHIVICLLVSVLIISSCDRTSSNDDIDNFDRAAMLQFWATDFIIPAFEDYRNKTASLVSNYENFLNTKDEASLAALRKAWLTAYKAWQAVAFYEIGKAEELGLRNKTNIFPTSVIEIEANMNSADVNLDLPSNFDAQGFPALDYLLYGAASDDQAIIDRFSDENFSSYANILISRIHQLANLVYEDWNGPFMSTFITNDGSSGTASTDKLVNDFLFYYERFFRAGKVGIPAGIFSGTSSSGKVEAPFSSTHTKELFLDAFQNLANFYAGNSPYTNNSGPSLKSYIIEITSQNDFESLDQKIVDQWAMVSAEVAPLNPSFKFQIEEDNSPLLKAYDEIQKGVILLKVDMMQLLNIRVDYVDADGD